jgi:cytochrome oxidase Cu insertion factor (SCO1/SenC/PrrC family)
MRRFLSLSLLAILALAGATAVSAQEGGAAPGRREGALKQGDPAPEFALKTVDETRDVRLSELRGRPVVLIFGSCT